MFNYSSKVITLALLCVSSTLVQADDLDIYAGATVTGSATPELVFAIDTSRSMSCALDQNVDDDTVECYLNTHEYVRNLYPMFDASFGTGGYVVPENVKIHLVRQVMTNVLSDSDSLPDDVKVGMAFYNDPGGAIVQPLKELGAATGNDTYATHRELLQAELNNVVPNGSTPIMGTLLEIGQYLTSGEVINGKSRMPAQAGYLDEKGFDASGLYALPETETYGQTARISNLETVVPDTANYSVNALCEAAIQQDLVTGKGNSECTSESLGSTNDSVFYNEDINRASVCGGNADLASDMATTQVVLLSDGLATNEDLSFVANGVSMATWVNRFVSGNSNASGGLAAGAFDQSAEGFPEDAKFDNDLGCPATAHTNAHDNTETRKSQFESCLYNIANRFRELGVKVNVIGFDIGDGFDVDNNYLKKIAEITGGDFRSTSDVGELESFISNLASGSVPASKLSVALSPSVAVNPGSILTNSGEVYVPGFEAGTSSFYYGNLKKYQVEVRPVGADAEGNASQYETVLVGANGDATEECDVAGSEEVYTCFREEVRDFWSDVPNGGVVTLGGAAALQGVYGPNPDGERNIFIQNSDGSQNLSRLNLVASDEDPVDNPEYGSPDESALRIDDAGVGLATKNYYAQLVENPDMPGNKFTDFSELQALADDGFPGVLSDTYAYDLLRWLNGFDQNRFNAEGGYTSVGGLNERASLGGGAPATDNEDLQKSRLYYGAVVHSAPTVVNYGFTRNADGSLTYDNTVFVSGNDGFLRAVNADDGTEEFAFFPKALLPNLSAWYQNTPGKIVYGLDSTWTPWRQDLPDSDGNFDGQVEDGNGFVRLYGGMRRGGSSYYFLDVTNRNQPRLLREISPQDPDQEFAYLGQTWSQPVLARVKKPGQSFPTVVAIFGGGYDPDYDPEIAENADPRCLDTEEEKVVCGNQIYMVDAGGYTGQPSDENSVGDILWWASSRGAPSGYTVSGTMHSVLDNMVHSIPSKVKTIDINDDGYTDRIYVGDLGGQVFRVKIDNEIDDASDPQNNFITIDTLAQVGHEGFGSPGDEDNRMFYEAPSVAVMKNHNQRYIGVAIASGWRANPADKDIDEELYFFRDALTGNETVIKRPDGGSTADFILGLEGYEGTQAELDAARAVAASLDSDGGDAGEKAFGSPLILRGNVLLPIYIPPTEVEKQASLNNCTPPPHRSSVVGFRAQSDAMAFVVNNSGNIVLGEPPAGAVAAHFRSDSVRSVPFSGLGVHVGNDSISILAGTESITIPLPEDTVRKTSWKQLGSGHDLVEQLENRVTGPE